MLTEIQYRTFDDLMDSVKIDLRTFDLDGMLDPQHLIKVAMKVNYELGLKINPSRSKAIEIHKGKGKLPLDFHVLNFALLCEGIVTPHTHAQPVSEHVHEHLNNEHHHHSGANSAEIVSTPIGNSVVHYTLHGKRHEYNVLTPLRIDKNKSVSVDCFNTNSKDWHAAVIKNGFLVTNFDEGVVYINYQSLMEDDSGNLLVMDHPMINEYYEYALKQRIYENLLMSGENVMSFLQLVEQRLRTARNNALSFINTPDFRELRQVWEMNRKAQYHNYYNMFKA